MTGRTLRNVCLGMAVAGMTALQVSAASAGALIVSGDSSIANPLTGLFVSIDAGNQTFFGNLLQGGASVVVHDTSAPFIDPLADQIHSFYSGLGGTASTLLGSAQSVTAAALAGVNLYVAVAPADAYDATEIAALAGLLDAGGSVFLLGENGDSGVFAAMNANINAAIAALGGAMSIDGNLTDLGFIQATGSQIAVDPLMAGVATLTYGVPSTVSGGTSLLTGLLGQTFIAYQDAASLSVAEPAAILLLAAGLAGLGIARRRPAG